MSKEIKDLAGIGELFGEFRKLLMDLLRFGSERNTRRLKDEEQALKNEKVALMNRAITIKNACAELQLFEKLLKTSKKSNYSPQELKDLISSQGPSRLEVKGCEERELIHL